MNDVDNCWSEENLRKMMIDLFLGNVDIDKAKDENGKFTDEGLDKIIDDYNVIDNENSVELC